MIPKNRLEDAISAWTDEIGSEQIRLAFVGKMEAVLKLSQNEP